MQPLTTLLYTQLDIFIVEYFNHLLFINGLKLFASNTKLFNNF